MQLFEALGFPVNLPVGDLTGFWGRGRYVSPFLFLFLFLFFFFLYMFIFIVFWLSQFSFVLLRYSADIACIDRDDGRDVEMVGEVGGKV